MSMATLLAAKVSPGLTRIAKLRLRRFNATVAFVAAAVIGVGLLALGTNCCIVSSDFDQVAA